MTTSGGKSTTNGGLMLLAQRQGDCSVLLQSKDLTTVVVVLVRVLLYQEADERECGVFLQTKSPSIEMGYTGFIVPTVDFVETKQAGMN